MRSIIVFGIVVLCLSSAAANIDSTHIEIGLSTITTLFGFIQENFYKNEIQSEMKKSLHHLEKEFDYNIPDIFKSALIGNYEQVCFLFKNVVYI